MLDSIRSFETPEGIELELEIAGPVVRACAWLTDGAIRLAIYLLASTVLTWFGALGMGSFLIVVFLIEWFYPVIFEVTRGATPGKRAFNLEVCQDNGTPVTWPASIIRNLLRVADFLPVFYGVGLVSMLCNRDFKRLGDMVAGTVVVYRHEDGQAQGTVRDSEAHPAQAPSQVLQLAEQRAILDFAERSASLSADRVEELADILSPLTHSTGRNAADRLLGYASWIRKGT